MSGVDFQNGSRDELIGWFMQQLREAVLEAEAPANESREARYERIAKKYREAIQNLEDEKLLRTALINLDNIPMELVAEQAETSSIEELEEVIRLTSENFDFE